jgi:hypothetical protein
MGKEASKRKSGEGRDVEMGGKKKRRTEED